MQTSNIETHVMFQLSSCGAEVAMVRGGHHMELMVGNLTHMVSNMVEHMVPHTASGQCPRQRWRPCPMVQWTGQPWPSSGWP